MEHGKEYCSFCFDDKDSTAYLFLGDSREAAICGECVVAVSERYREILAGLMEYNSWSFDIQSEGVK